jgi:TPR repeat protein
MPGRNPRQSNPVAVARLYLTVVAAAVLLFGVMFGAREGRWDIGRLIVPAQPTTFEQARNDLRNGDYADALQLFSNESGKGNAEAQYWLGYMNELGLGTARDLQKAMALYRQAAGKNVVAADLRLGELYLHGNYVPPDSASAKSYLERAAYQGEPRAAMLLGEMYANGLGITPDTVKAYAWSEVATIEGDHLAMQERDTSRRQLDIKGQAAAVEKAKDILGEINQDKMAQLSGAKSARAEPSNSARSSTALSPPA